MNILIVEDDKINAFIIEKFLSKEFDLTVCHEPKEAIEMIGFKEFELLLLDINLGDGQMDGVELLSTIRKKEGYHDIPSIATTAYAMTGDKEKFIEYGFNDYISKPIKREELIDKIKHLSRKRVHH